MYIITQKVRETERERKSTWLSIEGGTTVLLMTTYLALFCLERKHLYLPLFLFAETCFVRMKREDVCWFPPLVFFFSSDCINSWPIWTILDASTRFDNETWRWQNLSRNSGVKLLMLPLYKYIHLVFKMKLRRRKASTDVLSQRDNNVLAALTRKPTLL